MIKLVRVRMPDIPQNFRGAKRIDWNRELLDAQQQILLGTAVKHGFKSARWKPAKRQLFRESHNKCAYCESKVPHVAHGDVEHYRPKDIYWWLAYNWDNYTSSCQICNQSYKSNNFPTKHARLPAPPVGAASTVADLAAMSIGMNRDPMVPSRGMPYADFEAEHRAEHPFIPDPYMDDPENMFGWKADDVIKEVEIFVLDTTADKAQVQEAIEKYLGLNRLELKQLRYDAYVKFMVFRKTLSEPSISPQTRADVQAVVDEMKTDNGIYAGMMRYFDRMFPA